MTSRSHGQQSPQDVEWLDVGPPDRSDMDRRPPGPRPHRRLLIAGIAVLAASTLVAVLSTRGTHHSGSRSAGSKSPSVSAGAGAVGVLPAAPPATATAVPVSGLPRVTDVGHSLLGVTEGWELFARGDNDVVRVQLAAGRVTVTPVPSIGTDGGVSFLVSHDHALVIPFDFVTGYSVADGARTVAASGALMAGGYVFPGPVDGQFWLQLGSPDNTTAFELVDATGRDLRQTITLPSTASGQTMSDGSGYLVVQGISGSYDARPGSLRRITSGNLIAVGPTEWLAEECDDVGQCSDVVVDKVTWRRQVVGPSVVPPALQVGAIAPDGSHAAVTRTTTRRRVAVNLMEIATGAQRTVADIPDTVFRDQILAWSPDSRWLFVIGESGAVQVIDTRTLQHVDLGVQLPPAVQVAVRPAHS